MTQVETIRGADEICHAFGRYHSAGVEGGGKRSTA
jgi:hypothetical protein